MTGAADIDLAAADRLLTTTRAVRRRLDLDRPVPRQVLLDCIAVAQPPDDVTQVALIPVGYYTGETFPPASRPPPETVAHWDTWTEPSR